MIPVFTKCTVALPVDESSCTTNELPQPLVIAAQIAGFWPAEIKTSSTSHGPSASKLPNRNFSCVIYDHSNLPSFEKQSISVKLMVWGSAFCSSGTVTSAFHPPSP